MTMLTDRAPAHPAIPIVRAQDFLASITGRVRAFQAARRAALLKKKTNLIVSGLDAHILRDIGLNPEIATKRERLAIDQRSGVCGFW